MHEGGERVREAKVGWSWRDCLLSAVSLSHVELERVGGSSRVSGHAHTARTAKERTAERGTASQLGSLPSVFFAFSY